MDFRKLLSVADYNKKEATYEASIKRYNSNLPPPKKLPKSNVLSGGVKAFLAKQQAEKEQREAEARRKKAELLSLRAQNTKSNKKAKIMASRTKDNDFSKIKLTEDEIEAKRKREYELMRQNLDSKVERMKARIELAEKEKLLPKKRKRKSKHSEVDESVEMEQKLNADAKLDKNMLDKSKPRPRPPPTMSFEELMKVAAKKQFEPLDIPVKKKEEEKLLTKKEKRQLEEERARARRKEQMEQERLCNTKLSTKTSSRETSIGKIPLKGEKSVDLTKPIVVHVQKSTAKPLCNGSKMKMPKSNGDIVKNVQNKVVSNKLKVSEQVSNKKPVEKNISTNSDQFKKPDLNSMEKNGVLKKKSSQSKNPKIAPVNWTVPTSNKPSNPPIDIAKMEEELRKKFEDDLEQKLAKLAEEKLKKKLEEEYEKKFAARLADIQKSVEEPKNTNKIQEKPKVDNAPQKIQPASTKPVAPPMSRKEYEKIMAAKRAAAAPKPQKKPFHFNPYLDPPRRLLEPLGRSKPPPKRRLESSDEEEEDDDDDDFIDRSGSQNDEDYSKYIKEIFGYDKNRYADIDDDDIIESSFSQVQKEEMISAKLGHLEDLEEERKLKEMEKRKKKNKKR